LTSVLLQLSHGVRSHHVRFLLAGVQTLWTQDTSDPTQDTSDRGHFGNCAELSARHIGTVRTLRHYFMKNSLASEN